MLTVLSAVTVKLYSEDVGAGPVCGGAAGAPALPPLLPLPAAPPAGGGQQALDSPQPPRRAALPPGQQSVKLYNHGEGPY